MRVTTLDERTLALLERLEALCAGGGYHILEAADLAPFSAEEAGQALICLSDARCVEIRPEHGQRHEHGRGERDEKDEQVEHRRHAAQEPAQKAEKEGGGTHPCEHGVPHNAANGKHERACPRQNARRHGKASPRPVRHRKNADKQRCRKDDEHLP